MKVLHSSCNAALRLWVCISGRSLVPVLQLLNVYFCCTGSNILLELRCTCLSAIQCLCPGRGGAKALLSDFDLVEKATSDDKWARLGDYEPDGTRGMKAPEVCAYIWP